MVRPPSGASTSLVLVLLLTACGSATSGVPSPADDAPSTAASDPAADPECAPTADGLATPLAAEAAPLAPFPWDDPDAVTLPGFDTEEVVPGGPPPDGIRPLDEPCVVPVAAGDAWLDDDDGVLVVTIGAAARAYPLAMLTQHEIVNDVLDGEPVTVTYCPLCNSGIAFSRVLDGEAWDFGTSGRLLRSNLVMYDRQTRTLWSQFTGEALWGDPAVVGRRLERLPTQLLAWSTFRGRFADGTVLGRASFPGRDYGRNPYPGYEDDPSGFLFRGPTDERLDPDERVVGLGDERDAVAVPLSRLRAERAVTVELDGAPVTVVWAPGQASAVDRAMVGDGRDVGQTGAFLVDGLEEVADGRFRDPSTGAVHDVTGAVVDGEATALRPVVLDDTFWFVWFAFRPETRVAAG